MKKIFLILLFTSQLFAQKPLLDLFDSGVAVVPNEIETTRYANAMTTPLADSQVVNINNLVSMLKDSLGIDSLPQAFDCIYIFASPTSESALKNLVRRVDDAEVVSTPIFTA